jgi:hypothetical protein
VSKGGAAEDHKGDEDDQSDPGYQVVNGDEGSDGELGAQPEGAEHHLSFDDKGTVLAFTE